MSETTKREEEIAEEFAMANRVYELFSAYERVETLKVFASLRYPRIEDRFFESVYRIITRKDVAARAVRGEAPHAE